MLLVLAVSITIRFLALLWSLQVLKQLRDWRVGLLTLMLGLMATRQSLTLGAGLAHGIGPGRSALTEMPGLLVSMLAFGFVFSFKEIIESRRAFEARQLKLERHLLQGQKLEALGRLAGGVSHDFNNLLMAVMGQADLALECVDRTHPSAIHILEIQRVADRARDLTKQLLAFARREEPRRELVDLSAMIRQTAPLLEQLIRADNRLEFELSGVNMVKADSSQMGQVLMNLVLNACDAIVGPGVIRITCGSGESAPMGEDEGSASTPWVQLSVRDTGVGMDAATRSRALEPFFTTKGLGKGTGLGLSMVHGIIEQHDGAIELESTAGAGTTVRIFLPSRPGALDAPSQGPRTDSPTSAVEPFATRHTGVGVAGRGRRGGAALGDKAARAPRIHCRRICRSERCGALVLPEHELSPAAVERRADGPHERH